MKFQSFFGFLYVFSMFFLASTRLRLNSTEVLAFTCCSWQQRAIEKRVWHNGAAAWNLHRSGLWESLRASWERGRDQRYAEIQRNQELNQAKYLLSISKWLLMRTANIGEAQLSPTSLRLVAAKTLGDSSAISFDENFNAFLLLKNVKNHTSRTSWWLTQMVVADGFTHFLWSSPFCSTVFVNAIGKQTAITTKLNIVLIIISHNYMYGRIQLVQLKFVVICLTRSKSARQTCKISHGTKLVLTNELAAHAEAENTRERERDWMHCWWILSLVCNGTSPKGRGQSVTELICVCVSLDPIDGYRWP